MPTTDSPPAPTGAQFLETQASPEFQELRSRLRRFVFPTTVFFLLWYAGSARLTASQAALTTALMPVAALLLSALVLGEPIRLAQWAGLGCVLLSIMVGAAGGHAAPETTEVMPDESEPEPVEPART